MASPNAGAFRRASSDSSIPCAPPPSTRSLPASSCSSSGSTEAQLSDHDRRVNSTFARTHSPYYLRSHGLSPGRESLASGRSFSAISGKLRLWGSSCFSSLHEDRTPPPDPGLLPLSLGESGVCGRSIIPVVQPDAKSLRERDQKPEIVATDGAIRASEGNYKRLPPPKEIEFVWAYKYRPTTLAGFICNRDRAEELQRMSKTHECSHFIFEGPPGVGKKTMVLAFLRDTFGLEKMKMKNELKRIELKGEHVVSIDLNVRQSSQHIEVNLSESHGYEQHIIMTLINEFHIPSQQPVQCDLTNCKAIVLHEADKISIDTQHYIRWLMDKYKGCNKLFFCCSDASKLQTIKHLCKIIYLKPPSDKEIVEVLEFIADQEGVGLTHCIAERIAENSKHNLRQAIRSLEASWKSYYQLGEAQEILTGWEADIANIAKNIIEEQSPKQLYIIRGKLKNLIEHDLSPAFIFNTLVSELKQHLEEHFQLKVDALYREYNIWDNNGRILNEEKTVAATHGPNEEAGKRLHDRKKNVQHFMRIEEFTAKFMSSYKAFVTKNSGGISKYSKGPTMVA